MRLPDPADNWPRSIAVLAAALLVAGSLAYAITTAMLPAETTPGPVVAVSAHPGRTAAGSAGGSAPPGVVPLWSRQTQPPPARGLIAAAPATVSRPHRPAGAPPPQPGPSQTRPAPRPTTAPPPTTQPPPPTTQPPPSSPPPTTPQPTTPAPTPTAT